MGHCAVITHGFPSAMLPEEWASHWGGEKQQLKSTSKWRGLNQAVSSAPRLWLSQQGRLNTENYTGIAVGSTPLKKNFFFVTLVLIYLSGAQLNTEVYVWLFFFVCNTVVNYLFTSVLQGCDGGGYEEIFLLGFLKSIHYSNLRTTSPAQELGGKCDWLLGLVSVNPASSGQMPLSAVLSS